MMRSDEVCGWCSVFVEHLEELMLLALAFTGREALVEAVVLDGLDRAIAEADGEPSRVTARRFVLRSALHVLWRALQPEDAVLAAA